MDIEPIIEYWDNGKIHREYWHSNRKLHRVDGPADIFYYESGKKQREV